MCHLLVLPCPIYVRVSTPRRPRIRRELPCRNRLRSIEAMAQVNRTENFHAAPIINRQPMKTSQRRNQEFPTSRTAVPLKMVLRSHMDIHYNNRLRNVLLDAVVPFSPRRPPVFDIYKLTVYVRRPISPSRRTCKGALTHSI